MAPFVLQSTPFGGSMAQGIELTNGNYEATVSDPDRVVVVDFWADWCTPCKALDPVLSELAAERSDVLLGKVNVDSEPELTQSHGIVSIPTLLFYKGGELVKKQVGAVPKKALLGILDSI